MSGHKILIEIDDDAYDYWKKRAEEEGEGMQALIGGMVCQMPRAEAGEDGKDD